MANKAAVVICIVIGSILLTMIISGILYLTTKGKLFNHFYHDILEWHIPDDNVERCSDGLSEHSICKFCGKDIMQDSQGNWF